MSWNPTLNYPGDCRDVLGQIVGPTDHKEYFTVIKVEFDGSQTKATLALLDKDKLTQEAVDLFRVSRAKKIASENGRQFLSEYVPVAFRKEVVFA